MLGLPLGYAPIGGVFQSTAATPFAAVLDTQIFQRKSLNYLFQSNFNEPRIPAALGKFFNDAWADPADVFPYRKPNNWWIRIAPLYQSNPGTINILYAGAWEVNNQVRYYPRPNYWWTQLPEKYEANPANIGILYAGAWEILAHVFPYRRPNYWWTQLPEKYEANPATIKILYAGAWEVNNQVRYYPARNFTTIMAQSVMQPELSTIGLIFSAAFTVQLVAPTRRALNLNFLSQNPVIDFTSALSGIGEYIITLRRRRR